MPSGYLKIKKAFVKKQGKKEGTKTAAKIWNSMNKGTGQTVGRGRK